MSETDNTRYANDCVYKLCTWLVQGRLNGGQLASLRRAHPHDRPPAYYWLAAQIEQELLQRLISAEDENRWSMLIHCLAILTPPGNQTFSEAGQSPRNPHRKNIALGQALYDANFSELRLAALLDAEGEQFVQKTTRMCRFLASKQQKFNAEELALLIFHDTQSRPLFDNSRQSIARCYYRRAAKVSLTPDTAKDAS